jgi:hypothetical protein
MHLRCRRFVGNPHRSVQCECGILPRGAGVTGWKYAAGSRVYWGDTLHEASGRCRPEQMRPRRDRNATGAFGRAIGGLRG